MNHSLLAIAALLALLSGCGQKGPLYLPGDPSEVQTEIPELDNGSLPADDEDEDGNEPDNDN